MTNFYRASWLCVIALSGCGAGTESDFLCKAQIGTNPCASISETDGTSSGPIVPVTEKPTDTALKSLSQEKISVSGHKGGSLVPDGGFPYQSAQYRVPEVVGKLWIAPFLDGDGMLHESRYVHFVVTEAKWENR
jgi:conjugal transfer pilus assembly protein TraV